MAAFRRAPAVLGAALPLAAAGGLVLAVVLMWARGDPSPWPALVPANDAAALPVMDMACQDDVILADPVLQDASFVGAVVVLCVHTSAGALGLVLNRPTDMHPRWVVPQAPMAAAPVRSGGPVAPDAPLVLYRQDGQFRLTTGALALTFPQVGWALPPRVTWEQVESVFVGHAGWGPGQLEAEVEAGAWILTDQSAAAWLKH